MKMVPYKVKKIFLECEDTHTVRVVPSNPKDRLSFVPGQYVYIANPLYDNPTEIHPFSIASKPGDTEVEFCIKSYGNWTRKLKELTSGDVVYLSKPYGSFIQDGSEKDIVFLLGGIGISPIMSMLRFFADSNISIPITILYGNRTPDTVAYKGELAALAQRLPFMKVVHIYSDIPQNSSVNGYSGFITKDILLKEINFVNNPAFFIVGPPIFISKMDKLLKDENIPNKRIKKEILEKQQSHEPIFFAVDGGERVGSFARGK